MKTLEVIQKTFNIFKFITKIVEIFCIVGAVVLGTGAICAVIQYNGGQTFLLFGKPLEIFKDKTALLQIYTKQMSYTFMLIAEAVLFGFAHRYFKTELQDGTPFTENGAEKLLRLGIRFIYIPMLADAASKITAAVSVAKDNIDIGSFSTITGIVLILVSIVFRYGAELEGRCADKSQDCSDTEKDM